MCLDCRASVLLSVLLLSALCFGQLPSARCDSSQTALADCPSFTQFDATKSGAFNPATLLDPSAAMEADSDGATDAPTSAHNAISGVALQPSTFTGGEL